MEGYSSFNLEPYSLLAAKQTRPVRVMLVAGIALSLALIVGILLFNIGRRTVAENIAQTYGAAYVGLGVMVIILVWTLWLTRRGSIKLEIDSTQICLTWPSGRVEILSWQDPMIRLDLYDYSGDPLVANSSYRELRMTNRPKTVIPPAAFESLIRHARENGLYVIETSPSPAWYGHCRRVKVRGAGRRRSPN